MADARLSETYECAEDSCKLSVGLMIPSSSFADVAASTVMDLAEKVHIAGSAKWKAEAKENVLRKGGNDLDEEIVTAPKAVLHAAWRVALARCPHRRDAFIASIGKSELTQNSGDLEMVHNMMAFVANAKFMGSSGKTDVVVAGGQNASIFARAINAQHWPMMVPDECLLRSKVIFGAAVKKVIYIPNGELFFRFTRIIGNVIFL
uniref:Uncharacterized protein n=1 Tax=Panagrolaimus superbus TaxID=310955 RepID=A0A914Y438_9BILA